MYRNWTWQDWILRGLIVLGGGLAATLFILQGKAEVLPALAIGSVLGVLLMDRGAGDRI
ncbi:MAG: hypothetical protein ABI718_04390 [Acidobacteriota bacterium]